MPINIETPFVISAVRAKARKLKAHTCFFDKDFEDIEADLFVHLWDAGLALPSWLFTDAPLIRAILNRKGVDMLRHQMSKKEMARHATASLDAVVGMDLDEKPQTLADALPFCAPCIVDEVAFRIDFAERLAALSDDLQTIVEKMLQGRTHADIAQEMSLTRSKFHRTYATPIQKLLFPEWHAKVRGIGLLPKSRERHNG